MGGRSWTLVSLAALACTPETPKPAAAPPSAPAAATVLPTAPHAPASLEAADVPRARFRARALLEASRFDEAAAAFNALLAGATALPVDAAGALQARLLGHPEGPVTPPAGALALAGRAPAVDYLLGHVARRAGRGDEARQRFEAARKAAPDAAEATYWLAVTLADDLARPAEARPLFEALAALGPATGTLHALPAMYRAAMLAPPAERTARLADYQRAFQSRGQAATPDEVLFHGRLTALDVPPPDPSVRARPQAPVFTRRPLAGLPALRGEVLAVSFPAGIAGPPRLHAATSDGVISVTPAGQATPVPLTGRVTALVAADADGDGDPDLAVLGPQAGLLPTDATAGGVVAWKGLGPAAAALPLDVDHDGDLDWLFTQAGAPPVLLRALGPGVGRLTMRFAAEPGAAGLGGATGVAGAAAILADDDPRVDLVTWGTRLGLWRADRPGAFVDVTPLSGLSGPETAGTVAVVVEDFDADGRFDVVSSGPKGTWLHRNQGGLRFAPAVRVTDAAEWLVTGDFDADGGLDFVAARRNGPPTLCRGGDARGFDCAPLAGIEALRAPVAADLDENGSLDLAGFDAGGLVVLSNTPRTDAHVLRLDLSGHASNREGVGVVVEIQAGDRYQRYLSRPGVWPIGLGAARQADVLRLRWPTSASQSLLDVAEGALALREPADLMGSCPYLYAWNGQRHVFLGDVMGQAPIGIPVAPGVLVNADPTEPFLISGDDLAVEDGRIRMVLKEEFREITYVDALQLEALDRPLGLGVHVCADGRCKAPPFPERPLYASAGVRPPRAALDTAGRDVTALLSAVDGQAVGGVATPGTPGVVATHSLTLDLGPIAPTDRPVLYLDGWVFWGGANTNAALFQDPERPPLWPQVEVPDGRGGWRVAVPDMGIPAGTTTRGIPVPLTGLLNPADPRVRISTNLQAYWDRALVGLDGGDALGMLHLRPVPIASAVLGFRGLSTRLRNGGDGRGPADWDYERLTAPLDVRWGQVAGGHTAYGDVRAALLAADDDLVTLDAGDELSLSFDVSGLPPPAPMMRRDWLLTTSGWDKDTNMHTAGNESVGPLPFQGMPGHPYASGDRPPVRTARPRAPAPLMVDLRLRALDGP